MWIYALGETLKRATLTSHASTSRLSGELCQVLAGMTRPQASSRASLMHLLDVSKIHVYRAFIMGPSVDGLLTYVKCGLQNDVLNAFLHK